MAEHDVYLVVDDEADMCWALEHILQRNGFRTCAALSAEEACQLMAVGRYRLAFLDAKLPDMDGLELARRLREIDAGTSIVMVSGYFYKDDIAVQHALADGLICGFISKPFQHEEILRAVVAACPCAA